MLSLINIQTGTFVTGETKIDLIRQISIIKFDIEARRINIKGTPDTVSFSIEFQTDELLTEMANRALKVLIRDYGWSFYKQSSI